MREQPPNISPVPVAERRQPPGRTPRLGFRLWRDVPSPWGIACLDAAGTAAQERSKEGGEASEVTKAADASRAERSDPELITLPPLLTVQELARFLRIPVKTLYQWHYLGTGPAAIRVGRHLRYRRSAVAQWLVSAEVGGSG